MKQKWTNIKLYETEILEMRAGGKTRQEIADTLGLTKKQVKNWVSRYNKSLRKEIVIPLRKGRPRKKPLTEERAKELRINELEREVALYKSFLHAVGRR